ncbi:hypothetical protein ACJIZ3_001185 [Penstemon smallii]|uniref:Glycosyltransferase 61 catalytic domain-containing protein n=1 Tax=Penstemon smallii TaxID=265156 RepID=A0ABD3U312_9LAMI
MNLGSNLSHGDINSFRTRKRPKLQQKFSSQSSNSTQSTFFHDCREELRDSVTFLPLKDLRYAKEPMKDQTWFMSSMYDFHEEGQALYQHFPSKASKGRVLCLKGNNTNDGSWNSYALAYPDALPPNATFKKGVTFVSNNHYDFDNIWHGLSATMAFVSWHVKNQCAVPSNWILYHWGELRSNMALWLRTLLEATFSNAPIYMEKFDDRDSTFCFEEAVVMRHNEGGMSNEKRMETYDLIRCKARMYCNVSSEGRYENGFKIGMTLFMRDGARSFKNSSVVISVFEKECRKVEGCRLTVAYSHNLTVCQQVELMSLTDILVSPHGAQLTNMFLMDRNSSVMEFFPKGWLKVAGVGQFIYHWFADWSGMKHQGAWRDLDGVDCPYPEDDARCFSVFKDGKIGHNETYFSEWAINVLHYQVKIRKAELQEQAERNISRIVSPASDRSRKNSKIRFLHVSFHNLTLRIYWAYTMKKTPSSAEIENNLNSNRTSPLKSNHFPLKVSQCCIYILLPIFVLILILFQIQSLQTITSSSWTLVHQWQEIVINSSTIHREEDPKVSKLRDSVTFLPLKDLRYAKEAMKGHTWFMSSLYDMHEEGQVQYQQFPSRNSKGRVLCLKGHDTHDGSWNSYALAWPNALPPNATIKKGITFISYNHYDYHNIWHGLSAMMPFVAWHIKSQCDVPRSWILYHWGELRSSMAPWVQTLLEATFGGPIYIEKSVEEDDDSPCCFEEAVVMRHNEGGMSKDKRMESYDLMRCKARMYCNVSREKGFKIGMTMLMRTGTRSFKNSSGVISVFDKECRKVEGCRLMVAYPHNLTFCEQVELMSLTDIVISAHGAQLSNMILMDRNSSVMELFPKGWLELAGVGQYVHHWLANWSGMKHQGAWRDPVGDNCPYPDDNDRRCMSMFKNARIGHNETYFSEWARNVLDYQLQLQEQGILRRNRGGLVSPVSGLCGCI